MPTPLLLLAALAFQQPVTKTVSVVRPDFRVEFPATPAEQAKAFPTPDGPIEVQFFKLTYGRIEYTVSRASYPAKLAEGDPEPMLEGAAGALIRDFEGRVLSKKNFGAAGLFGKELTFSFDLADGQSGVGRFRLMKKGEKVYSLLIAGRKEEIAGLAPAFFSSFRLADPSTDAQMPANPAAPATEPAAFTSESGRFRAAFPAVPTVKTTRVEGADGPYELHQFTATAAETTCGVTYRDLRTPPADVAGYLESLVAATVKRPGHTLISSAARGKGREFTYRIALADGRKATCRCLVTVDRDRMYQAWSMSARPVAEPGGVDGFLGSFAVVPRAVR